MITKRRSVLIYYYGELHITGCAGSFGPHSTYGFARTKNICCAQQLAASELKKRLSFDLFLPLVDTRRGDGGVPAKTAPVSSSPRRRDLAAPPACQRAKAFVPAKQPERARCVSAYHPDGERRRKVARRSVLLARRKSTVGRVLFSPLRLPPLGARTEQGEEKAREMLASHDVYRISSYPPLHVACKQRSSIQILGLMLLNKNIIKAPRFPRPDDP